MQPFFSINAAPSQQFMLMFIYVWYLARYICW